MLKHKKFNIHFEVLYNWEKWLLRMNRTHHNPSKFTQIAGIISGKLDLLFIDDQIQRFREYFHTIMIKSLVGIVLFSTLFAKKGQGISGTCRLLLVWDSRIQKTNSSLLSIMKDQQKNQLANIFCEYLQKELSIKVQGEPLKL